MSNRARRASRRAPPTRCACTSATPASAPAAGPSPAPCAAVPCPCRRHDRGDCRLGRRRPPRFDPTRCHLGTGAANRAVQPR
eukprot:2460021-Prymnesium_polylepis.2